jgi:hypothetical protein
MAQNALRPSAVASGALVLGGVQGMAGGMRRQTTGCGSGADSERVHLFRSRRLISVPPGTSLVLFSSLSPAVLAITGSSPRPASKPAERKPRGRPPNATARWAAAKAAKKGKEGEEVVLEAIIEIVVVEVFPPILLKRLDAQRCGLGRALGHGVCNGTGCGYVARFTCTRVYDSWIR